VGAELGSMKQVVEKQDSDKVKAMFGILTIRYYF